MAKRLLALGCACALAVVGGCGGDGGGGNDAGGGGSDTGVDGGTTPTPDTGVDAGMVTPVDMGTPPVDMGTPAVDMGMDAGMASTDGCELGNTYPALDLDLVGTAPAIPVGIMLAPGRDDLFLVLRRGQIVIMNPTTGDVGATPFLDVSSRLGGTPTGSDEWGLLGLAFHPDYETNGLVYIAYTAAVGGAYEDRVAVATRATADTATFGSDIFTISDPRSNHNGGQLGFGPDDGFLYYGVGDGGEQGDPSHRGQDTSVALGKIHRFEVGPGIATYNPAPGNPFIGGGGLATIWAYGLRNPWRFSWDRRTHDMYIGDVGQDTWEEIDYLPAPLTAGTNFGWSVCEGTHDFNGTCSSLTGDVLPITEYNHSDTVLMHTSGNASVTGGYVYRGTAIAGLNGAYFYADEVSSQVAVLRNCRGTPVTPVAVDFATATCGNPTSFGEDANGEILVACFSGRQIYRIVAAP